jgi:hypothetical protein
MSCSDPSINYLQSLGYSVIRLPKADVAPLEILMRQGRDLERLGLLSTLLVGDDQHALPAVARDVPAATISGRRTGDLSAGIGLSVLGSVLGAMGGSTLGLDAHYQQARSITFEFHDVLEDRVEVARLDQYLAAADVNPASRYVGELLEADDLYVTTATIKSKKLTAEAKTSSGADLSLSVPAIQGLVGGNVAVSQHGEATNRLTYEGPVPLVFGFKAIRLFYEQGRYRAFKPVAPSVGMKAPPPAEVDPLQSSGPFVRLRVE